jgi:hypothetical protein
MDISRQLHNDHADLRALAEDILQASDGGDVGGRDNQFDLYDIQVRRHLAVIEDAKDSCADVMAQHKAIRRELSALDRSGKGSNEWTAEFRNLNEQFDAVCRRHEALLQHAARISGDIGDQYEQAKARRMRGGQWSWNRVPTGKAAAVAGAAAAVAGAALAASYFRSGRRSSGRTEDDFELRLETDENLRLISSAKVEGTPVVDRDGARIGTISNFMVDKYTGRVAYAVMKFGGGLTGAFANFGASLFPLPWPVLDYDENAGGYMLDIAKEDMADAPRFEASAEPEFSPEYRREILLFYRPVGAGGSFGSSTGGSNIENSRSTASSESQPMASPEPTSVG